MAPSRQTLSLAAGAAALAVTAAVLPAPVARAKVKGCPDGMVAVLGQFCIDKYEAHVVEVVELPAKKPAKKGQKPKLSTKAHSPFADVEGLRVKAVSKQGALPQAYISRDQAEAACKEAGKRLCTDAEWVQACKGKKPTLYPYGDTQQPGRCNDSGTSSFNHYFGKGGGPADKSTYTWENMNDPRLNQLKGTLAKSGAFARCKNGFGAHDMVGNLHEWTAAPSGTFRGGYYLDVTINGQGCDYKTTAHHAKYHDYSTGFRCCKG